MTYFVRALCSSLFTLCAAVAVACSGGGGTGGPGGPGGSGANGTGAGTTGNGNSGTGNAGTGNGSTTSGGVDWTGTWILDTSYAVSCDFGFGNVKMASWMQTDTLDITGGSGLSVSFPNDVNYSMSGTGTEAQLVLTGQYPAKDDGGDQGSIGQDENTITIKLDQIAGPNLASGSMTGQFVGSFGQKCTISGGMAKLSR